MKLLLAIVPKQDAMFIELVASTDLRVCEAVALQRKDFYPDGPCLT